MRNRTNLLAFAVTLGAAGAGQLGRPPTALAAAEPTPLTASCCTLGTKTCCFKSGCTITPSGCYGVV